MQPSYLMNSEFSSSLDRFIQDFCLCLYHQTASVFMSLNAEDEKDQIIHALSQKCVRKPLPIGPTETS